ncbi:MAG: hypothetical protein C4518_01410 [Desulfobacteraceae bacterium]|nr:MAG: hypothetical protein C4518_01410 [Desulfobacteraceae bacterium]
MSKKLSKGKNISVWINDNDLMEKINKFSQKAEIEPRQFIKNSIVVGIEEMTILDNIGYIKTTLLLKNFREQLAAALDIQESTNSDFTEKIMPFTIMLDHDVISKLDYFKDKLSLKSRSDLIVKLITMNLRDMVYFEITGLLQLSIFLKKQWRKRFKEAEDAIKKGEIKLDIKK